MTDNVKAFLGVCIFNKEMLDLASTDLPAAIAQSGLELDETEQQMVSDALERAGASMRTTCEQLGGMTGDDITATTMPDREQQPGFTGVTG